MTGKGTGLAIVASCMMMLVLAPSVDAGESTAKASSSGDQTLAQSLDGTWSGTYTCSQGLTGLTLELSYAGGEQLTGVFNFYEVASNPGVPTGSYKMTGSVASGALTLHGTEWLKQPSGYVLVGLKTTLPVEANGTVGKPLHGEVLENSSCTTFDLAPGAPAAGPVKILSGPPKETSNQNAVFTFSASLGTFECSIDDGPFTACVSGQRFSSIAPGDHLFQVRATLNGMPGPASSYRWTVDLPRACVLRVARARVFAFAHQGTARLVIHYKAYRPAKVTVAYKLKGAKGGLALGSASSQFKKAGIFRLSKSLSKEQTAKLRVTKSMTVHFAIPAAPNKCGRYYTKRLTIPKKIYGQTVWFQSDSRFTPKTGQPNQ